MDCSSYNIKLLMQMLFLINHFTFLNFLHVKLAFTCRSFIFTDNLHILEYNSNLTLLRDGLILPEKL